MPLNLSAADAAELKENIARWRWDPVAFVLEVFGPGYEEATGLPLVVDEWQKDFLRACIGRKRRVAAKACKGPGKTAALAWVAFWFLTTRQHPKLACCSITGDNLSDGLWTELSLWMRYSPLMRALFEKKGEVLESRDHPDTWYLSPRTYRQDADLEAQAETLAGLHADSVCILLDEVGSFPHGVFNAASAIFNVQGVDALLVVAGNCTDVDGPLFRLCTQDADLWDVVTITGDPEDPKRSPRIDLEEARAQIAKYGRDDSVVKVNILGEFPLRAGNKLLGPDAVLRAAQRNPREREYEREARVWGLDVAGQGLDPDTAVLCKRQGCTTLGAMKSWRNLLCDDLADRVVLEVMADRKAMRGPDKLFVDKGSIGRAVYERLRSLLGNLVEGVDFGGRALDETLYANRRAEMWWTMAQWVSEVGAIPDSPNLRRDLTAPSTKTVTTAQGTRRQLESKEDMRKRGLPSPDEGDALALTFAAPVLTAPMQDSFSRKGAAAVTPYQPPWERSAP